MPYVNGKFYLNPSFGRAVENARRAEATPHPVDKQGDQEAHWVTIAGRHILIGEAQTQRGLSAIRDRIVADARIHDGSSDWAVNKMKDNFAPGTDKCNKFVYDVTKEAGAKAIVIGSNGKPRPPLAAEWADVKTPISGWRVLGPTEMPRSGDVAAYKLPGHANYTGHSGIVTSVDLDGTVRAIAAHQDVVGPDDKFNGAPGRNVVYRRYEGGQ